MSIALDPSELTFHRPFTREVAQTLRIKNTNRDPIAFKVKTTAPKQYCVRPNSGRIEVGQDVEVQVLLQAMKSDPPADYKCRDKFLVQSIAITADREATNVQQIWSHVETTEKSAIQEKKIRVVYLQPGDATNGTVAAGEVSFESSPPPYTSPSPGTETHSTPAPMPKHILKSGSSNLTPSVGERSSTRATNESSELAAAKATIARLEEDIKQQALRSRNSGGVADTKGRIAQGTSAMGITTHPPEGIPIHICAGLCLTFFFIAWFFF